MKIKTWVEIEKHFTGKNAKQCAYRFKKIYREKTKPWSRLEEHDLKTLTEKYGENFEYLKAFFPKRTVKEIKEKYISKISIDRKTFSPEEDLIILKLYNNKELSEEENIIIKSKSPEEVKKRLSLLLMLKKEKSDDDSNLNINSLLCDLPLKEDDITSQIFSHNNLSISESLPYNLCLIESISQEVGYNTDNQSLNENINDKFKLKNQSTQNTTLLNNIIYCNNTKDPLNLNSKNVNFIENDTLSDKCIMEKAEKLGNSCNLKLLMDKKTFLKDVLQQVNSLSNIFCEDFESKIWESKLNNDLKVKIIGNYNRCIQEANSLFKENDKIVLDDLNSEKALEEIFLKKIILINELIKLEKTKMSLLGSVYNQ